MQYYNQGYDNQRRGFLSGVPKVTRNLLIINGIMFLATLLNQPFMVETFALFYPKSQFFHWWQPVTHMFMHGNFWHLFFNMYTLLIFGSVVERTIGEKKFLVFYFVCGLGAAALHTGIQAIQAQTFLNAVANGTGAAATSYMQLKMIPTVGASGAIYGILLGYAMLYPDSRLTLIFPPITFRAKTMVLIFLGIELLTGVLGTQDGVAHFAHLGGMLFGWLMIRYCKKKGILFDRDRL